jgi:hypothetical protein
MEVHAARGDQLVARRRAAAIGRRRHAVGSREGAGEGLGRPISGIQSDGDHLIVTGGELVRGTLHQQPPAQRARRLAQRRRHQPVEVEPRQVRLAGQLLAVQIRLGEAPLDDVEQPLQAIGGDHVRHPATRFAGVPDRICSICVVASSAYQSASVFSSIDPASTAFWNASSSSGGIVYVCSSAGYTWFRTSAA